MTSRPAPSNAAEMKRDLVLLTHQYPHAEGDAAFVEAEIWGLSAQFDHVYVWTLEPSDTPRVDMPANVEWVGSLFGDRRVATAAVARGALLHPLRVLQLVTEEVRARRRNVKLARAVRAAVISVVGGQRLGGWLKRYRSAEAMPVLYSFWGTDCALVLLSPRVHGARTVVRVHGYDLYEDRVGYLPFRRKLFARTDQVLAVSQHGADYLERSWNTEALPPVAVARLGTPDHGRGPGAPADVVRIVSCSSMVPVKRIDAVFDVVNALANDRPVEWVHFGDGVMRSQLEARFAAKSQHLRVKLMGAVKRPQVFDYYRQTPVSAFLNMSSSEGLPVSIMEAMSFGIPVVATDVGGTGELVGRSHRSGVLVSAKPSLHECLEAVRSVIDGAEGLDPRAAWSRLCDVRANSHATARIVMQAGAGARP